MTPVITKPATTSSLPSHAKERRHELTCRRNEHHVHGHSRLSVRRLSRDQRLGSLGVIYGDSQCGIYHDCCESHVIYCLVGAAMSELTRGDYGWVEAGTCLYFEKQPNKSAIPRLGKHYESFEVVKMEVYRALTTTHQQAIEALTAQLQAQKEEAAVRRENCIEYYDERIKTLERELDDAIKMSRYAVYEALLSSGHTKDEHTGQVFAQWKQAIDDAIKAEQQLDLERIKTCQALEQEKHAYDQLATLQARLSYLENRLKFIASQHDKAGNWAVEIAKGSLAALHGMPPAGEEGKDE